MSNYIKDLISVIVPVYNVEKYVAKCIDSILSQTYTNFELILVNDCSKDNSLKVLQEYEEKYKNVLTAGGGESCSKITLINLTENVGGAEAKNVGYRQAKGEYIHFLDSDDYFSPDLFQKAIDKIKEINTELVLNFNVSLTYENDATSAIKKKLGEQDKNYIIKGYKGEGFFNANSLRITPQWRYLIKHSYLDSCVPFFIKGMTPNDDEYFANVVCRPLKQVYCYKGGQYNYLIKTDALSTNRQLYNFSNDFCYIDVFKYTYQFYKEHDLLDKLPVYDIGHIKGLVQGHIDKPHCYEKIRELFKEFYEVILFRQHLYSKDDINFVRSVMEYEKYSEWKQNSNSKEITKLFGVIPMLKVKKEGGKKKVWLFGIPILTTKIKK